MLTDKIIAQQIRSSVKAVGQKLRKDNIVNKQLSPDFVEDLFNTACKHREEWTERDLKQFVTQKMLRTVQLD